jgi:hypothetical protein
MSGAAWKMATAPMEDAGWSSMMGSKVTPPSTDFHSPPVAAPT